jgi:hypothetical protein
MVSRDIPFPGFETDAIQRSREMAYYQEAEAANPGHGDEAAFAVLYLLYSGSSVTNVWARFDQVQQRYTPAHSNRVTQAQIFLRSALAYAPGSENLRQELLDLYYNHALCEQMLAKELLAEVYQKRFDPPPSGGYIIDQEIAAYPAIIQAYREAAKPYFELLSDPMGVSSQPPFGYTLFHEEVWQRPLQEPTMVLTNGSGPQVCYVLDADSNGVPDTVSSRLPRQLTAGHKDLAMAMQVEQEWCDAVKDLAKLYLARDAAGDRPAAEEIVADTLAASIIEGRLLLAASDYAAHPPPASSGIPQTLSRWTQIINELTTLRNSIQAGSNPLGFTSDFLMLVKDPNNPDDPRDSYDVLKDYMTSSQYGPLTRALTKHQEAQASRQTFRQNLDQLRTHLNDLQSTYYNRLVELVGGWNWGYAGNISRLMADPKYRTPESNEGSLIWQQVQSMEKARLDVEIASQEVTNLIQRVEFEIDARGRARGVQNAIADTYIRYGEKKAKIAEDIASEEATFASIEADINRTKEGVDYGLMTGDAKCVVIGAVAGFAGGMAEGTLVIQPHYAELGRLEAQKERLAAMEQAEITSLNSQLQDIDSDKTIKTWMLEMGNLGLKAQQAQITYRQEAERLASLLNEKAELEARYAADCARQTEYYFADPSYRLAMNADMFDAVKAFEEAQRWAFYAVRALEYKWNIDPSYTLTNIGTNGQPVFTNGVPSFGADYVFKCRNAEELENLMAALDNWDKEHGFTYDQYIMWHKFSLRQDFLGYKDNQRYTDPVTGETNLTPKVAFQRYLSRSIQALVPGQYEDIVVPFNTVRQVPGTSFFQAAVYTTDGVPFAGHYGTWLDKIVRLRVRIRTAGTPGVVWPQLAGSLVYGGVSYIRNEYPGQFTGKTTNGLSVLQNEWKSWSTRHWWKSVSPDRWQSEPEYDVIVQFDIQGADTAPAGDDKHYDVTQLRERSVASTGWRLVIPYLDAGVQTAFINDIDDIHLWMNHKAKPRERPSP